MEWMKKNGTYKLQAAREGSRGLVQLVGVTKLLVKDALGQELGMKLKLGVQIMVQLSVLQVPKSLFPLQYLEVSDISKLCALYALYVKMAYCTYTQKSIALYQVDISTQY